LKTKSSHTTDLTVRGYELDSYGHVNNAVYLNYFEHGRWDLLRELNLYEFINISNLFMVVADIHISYMREAKLYDELEVQTSVVREDPYLIFKQKLLNRQSGQTLARGETRSIFIDKTTRKPTDIPNEFKAHF